MKILITGASSLAASRLVPLLIEEGHDITTTSRRHVASPRHIACDLAISADALPDETFDSILHFAAYVPHNERASTWEECAPANIGGTIHLLRWAERRAKRFLLASSLAVYDPSTNYAITKFAQEQLLAAFCVPRSIPLTILRLGYVYGPGIAETRAVMKLLQSVRDGRPIRLTAPSASLHLIHTDDVAHITSQLLHTDGTFNVVMPEPVTVRDYVEAAMEVVGRKVEIIVEPDTPTPYYSASPGIRPRVTLQEGIASL